MRLLFAVKYVQKCAAICCCVSARARYYGNKLLMFHGVLIGYNYPGFQDLISNIIRFFNLQIEAFS